MHFQGHEVKAPQEVTIIHNDNDQEAILDKLGTIKWITIGLHGIVLAFALFVVIALTGGDVLAAVTLSKTDAALHHALWLSALLIGGNVLGIILLLTPLFRSSVGSCVLVSYELAFLGISLLFFSPDYSVIIGIIVCALLYVAHMQRHRVQ